MVNGQAEGNPIIKGVSSSNALIFNKQFVTVTNPDQWSKVHVDSTDRFKST